MKRKKHKVREEEHLLHGGHSNDIVRFKKQNLPIGTFHGGLFLTALRVRKFVMALPSVSDILTTHGNRRRYTFELVNRGTTCLFSCRECLISC